jgi:hypothetical protein
VLVTAERLDGWLTRFAQRHGEPSWSTNGDEVVVRAADGAIARLAVPFPPLRVVDAAYGGLVGHALRDRTVGALLVRRGGYAAGVFVGARLESSKVGSRLVQGRSAAGGWSQQRFARRREGQARQAMEAAADVAARILLPAERLEAVVLGGDRKSLEAVLADGRLKELLPLVQDRRVDVPDPKLKVLQALPAQFRAVPIEVVDPPE